MVGVSTISVGSGAQFRTMWESGKGWGNKIGLRGGKMFDKRDIVLKRTIIGTGNVLIYFFL